MSSDGSRSARIAGLRARSLGWVVAACGLALALLGACGSGADSAPAGTGGATGGGGAPGGAGGVGGQAGTGGVNLGGTGGCIKTCSKDLHAVLGCQGEVLEACAANQGCDSVSLKCVSECEAAASRKRSVGCDYYAVFMDQLKESSCFAVFLANTGGTDATISLEYGGSTIDAGEYAYLPGGFGASLTYAKLGATPLAPGKVAILFLAGPDGAPAENNPVCPKPTAVPSGAMLAAKSGVGKAFHITTSSPVVAYQINPFGGGSAAVTGASLLIPSSAWGTNYLGMHAYDSGPEFTSLNIIARETTHLKLLPTKNIEAAAGVPFGPAGTQYDFTLQAGEHLQITQLAELDGTPIEADKPVGFMAGGRCSEIPANQYACDHVEQMIPPVTALGSDYVGVSFKSRGGEPERWRVLGVVDGTNLNWSSDFGAPTGINRGEKHEFTTSFPFEVKSQDKDHPFILLSLMTGGSTNGMNGIGDADSVLVVPPAQFLDSYVFFADPTYPTTNLVVVRAPVNGQFADVNLDCVTGPIQGWQKVGNYEYTRVDLTTGDFKNVGNCSSGAHAMNSDYPFGIWIWGWGSPGTSTFSQYVSYGYPGGMNLEPINNTIVKATPK